MVYSRPCNSIRQDKPICHPAVVKWSVLRNSLSFLGPWSFFSAFPLPERIRKGFPRVLMIDRARNRSQCCAQPQGLSK